MHATIKPYSDNFCMGSSHRGITGDLVDKVAKLECTSTSVDPSINENCFWLLVKEENGESWKFHYLNNIRHNSDDHGII